MTETSSPSLVFDSFLDMIKELPWCKQDGNVLVAVHKFTPEVIVAFSDHEAKVYPGGTPIKINKSWISTLQEKSNDGTPIPLVMAWKKTCIEIWYRRQKSMEYPYDTWQDPAANAIEKECVRISADFGGAKFAQYHSELLEKAKACPTVIPQM
ncbi:MAG: hypothetical protein K2X77_06445 [Candidatus Obscuribacterales bacterium]|jgi:hypothetical protein|nr:hypothetical protein [Candidatus Obscuribacterales bacterium]